MRRRSVLGVHSLVDGRAPAAHKRDGGGRDRRGLRAEQAAQRAAGLEADGGQREQGGQPGGLRADRPFEPAAAAAGRRVEARTRTLAPAALAVVAGGQRKLRVVAIQVGGVRQRLEALAGAEDQHLDVGLAHTKHLGDVRVGETRELAQDEGRPLLLAEPVEADAKHLEVDGQLRGVLQGDVLGRLRFGNVLDCHGQLAAADAVDRCISRDSVQPGAGLREPGSAVGADPGRGQERVLDGLFGVRPVAEHALRIAHQLGLELAVEPVEVARRAGRDGGDPHSGSIDVRLSPRHPQPSEPWPSSPPPGPELPPPGPEFPP